MGYDDEAGRSRRRQSKVRQPVKRTGDREPEYRRSREPQYEEPRHRAGSYKESGYRENKAGTGSDRNANLRELNLITDSFQNDRPRQSGDRQPASGRPKARQTAPARQTVPPGQAVPSRQPMSARQSTAARQSAAASQPDTGAYRTPAQKKAQKKKRRIIIILIEILILISVLVFAAFSYLNKSMNMIQRLPWNPGDIKNVEISEEKQEQMKGYWTIAVFGVDSRNSSVGKGNNSDVNMICNINQDTGEIKLVSVFRDTYLNINDKNSYNKINSAYLNGGPEQAVKALNKNLDLDIDDYATFNWKAVADAINILGGIDLELSKAEFYYINAFVTETVKATGIPSRPVKHAGAVHLDGVQAVAYGRLRLMDTDFARTERQRKIIALAFEKAKKADWATLNNIIQTVFPQVATSVEITDVIKMGRDIGRLHLGETNGFPAARSDMDMGAKGDCVIPQTLESNVKDIHNFLFSDATYEPTETVKTISKKIIADTGLAKNKKPVDHVDTDNGVIPKESKTTKETDDSTEETEESETYEGNRLAKPGISYETDSLGNVINPEIRESESNGVRPGMTEPETTEKPGNSQRETTGIPGGTESTEETIAPRPGTSNGGSNVPGSNTDTGVILGPGNGTSGSGQTAPGGSTGMGGSSTAPGGSSNTSGGNSNVPGGGSNTSGGSSNVPGGGSGTSGGSSNVPGGGSGTSGGSSNVPGGGSNTSGGSSTAPGVGSGTQGGSTAPGSGGTVPGSGNVNFTGPTGS